MLLMPLDCKGETVCQSRLTPREAVFPQRGAKQVRSRTDRERGALAGKALG